MDFTYYVVYPRPVRVLRSLANRILYWSDRYARIEIVATIQSSTTATAPEPGSWYVENHTSWTS